MATTRCLFSMLLALALCAKTLLLCDTAFAMPVAADAASSHCDMAGEPAPSAPAKAHVKPACVIGCPAIAAPAAAMAPPEMLYAAQPAIPPVDGLDSLHVPPAIPPPRPG